MHFGIALPTCTEGMAYPMGFGDHEAVLRIAREVEALGFDSVLVNDHLSTMPYVRETFEVPPRFYEPMISLAYVAAHTERVKLMTGVVVMPMRDPVLLAKQASCLDQMSGGRLILGVGVGSYRAEFESVRPRLKGAERGDLVEEGLRALQLLFSERRASFDGRHYAFEDVEMFPKPLQDPFPVLSCGNAPATIERAARWCAGWMPAGLPAGRMAKGVAALREAAERAGRDPSSLTVAPQLVLCIDEDAARARQGFLDSQVHEHLVSLRRSTLRNVDLDAYVSENLIGDPDQVVARIERVAEAGADHLAGLIVAANTADEVLAQARLFAREVLPRFAEDRTP